MIDDILKDVRKEYNKQNFDSVTVFEDYYIKNAIASLLRASKREESDMMKELDIVFPHAQIINPPFFTIDYYKGICSDIFNAVKRIASYDGILAGGEHFTPKELSRLTARLCLLEKEGECNTIYDPTCGAGSLLIQSAEYIKTALGTDLSVYGEELNAKTAFLTKCEFFLLEKENYTIATGSVLRRDYFADKKFDLIVGNPPYGITWFEDAKYVKEEYAMKNGRFPSLASKTDGINLFLYHILYKLNENGRAAVITSESPYLHAHFQDPQSQFAKYLFDNDFLEAVICLPRHTFINTPIKSFLSVFNKNKPKKRKQLVQILTCYTQSSSKKSVKSFDELYDTYKGFTENDFSKIVTIDSLKTTQLSAYLYGKERKRFFITNDFTPDLIKQYKKISPFRTRIVKDCEGYVFNPEQFFYIPSLPRQEKEIINDMESHESSILKKTPQNTYKKYKKVDFPYVDHIPKHWEFIPDGFCIIKNNERKNLKGIRYNKSSPDKTRIINVCAFNKKTHSYRPKEYTDEKNKTLKTFKCKGGYAIIRTDFNKINGKTLLGEWHCCEEDGILWHISSIDVHAPFMLYRYYEYYMGGAFIQQQMIKDAQGSIVYHWKRLTSAHVLLPPFKEQIRIASWLDKELKDINMLITKYSCEYQELLRVKKEEKKKNLEKEIGYRKELALLMEFRRRKVTDVVTGKVMVSDKEYDF